MATRRFAANLRHVRQLRGLKVEALCRQLHCEPATWMRWENGQDEPDLIAALQIARLLDESLERLIERDLAQANRLARQFRPGLFVLDMDGTLTDGGMFYGPEASQFRRFDAHDGLCIHRMITRLGAEFGLVSSGSTPDILASRAQTLGIQRWHNGQQPKVETVTGWLTELGLQWDQVCYVGDDYNDLPALSRAGLGVCPANAPEPVKRSADIVLSRPGGQGAIRELIEEIMGYDLRN